MTLVLVLEITLTNSSFIVIEVIKLNETVLTASGETHIVCEPVDAHDTKCVATKYHSLACLACVEVEDVDLAV